ncbi:MAG: polyketide synthase dehydratase domain-containing protein, partial [Lentisphaerae bacterium]|nr:polyketide synthase dehydratase domain-containing protein [Lentisphaerota bacterium]
AEGPETVWTVRLFAPDEADRPFYSGRVVLADCYPAAPGANAPAAVEGAFPFASPEDAYRQRLFHGPVYRVIEAVRGFGAEGVDAVVRPGRARAVPDGGGPEPAWWFDPVLVDTVPQMAVFWSRERFDTFPLPNRIRACRVYAPLGDGPVDVAVRFDPSSSAAGYAADARITRGGVLLAELRGVEGAGSRELNRLSEQGPAGEREH